MFATRLNWVLVLLTAPTFVGCSGGANGGGDRQKVYPVKGKITMGGGPVANALVAFSPKAKQPVATGRTGNDGSFRLTTYDSGDGAAAGEFIVLVTKSGKKSTATDAVSAHDPDNPTSGAGAHDAATDGADTAADSGLPEKYSRVEQSDLTAVIKADGSNELTFDLKP